MYKGLLKGYFNKEYLFFSLLKTYLHIASITYFFRVYYFRIHFLLPCFPIGIIRNVSALIISTKPKFFAIKRNAGRDSTLVFIPEQEYLPIYTY